MSRTGVAETSVTRFDVNSVDGASIAVWVEGQGPALVMVHGSIADHTTFEPFIDVLRHRFTTFSMDRRAPTLFLAGSDSVPVVTQATDRAAAAIPDAKVHVLEGHGHFAHKTDPAMVAAIIEQFVAS
jgi:hypothetical protein